MRASYVFALLLIAAARADTFYGTAYTAWRSSDWHKLDKIAGYSYQGKEDCFNLCVAKDCDALNWGSPLTDASYECQLFKLPAWKLMPVDLNFADNGLPKNIYKDYWWHAYYRVRTTGGKPYVLKGLSKLKGAITQMVKDYESESWMPYRAEAAEGARGVEAAAPANFTRGALLACAVGASICLLGLALYKTKSKRVEVTGLDV